MRGSHLELSSSLQGQLLIAQPTANSTFFAQGVVLVCEHNADGAWGLVLNKPSKTIRVKDIATNVGIEYPYDHSVIIGGPVQPDSIYILHTPDYVESITRYVTNSLCVTSSINMLRAISRGAGPKDWQVFLGMSAWQSGQLEGEQSGQPPWTPEHRWMTTEANAGVLHEDPEYMWSDKLATSISSSVKDIFN